MLKFELLPDQNILLVTPDGAIEKDDFPRVSAAIDPIIKRNGKLRGVLLQAKSFPGWENFPAFLSHLRFISEHHTKIERIAVFTDAEGLKKLPGAVDHLVQAEIKQFDSDKRDQALAWLGGH